MGVHIRLLEREEIPRIWEIDRREYVENIYVMRDGRLALERHDFDVQGWPPGQPETETPSFFACFDHGGSVWAAFEGDVVVGAAILESRPIGRRRDTLQLMFLDVGNGHRRQGLGSRLFRTAAEEARRRGAKRLYVSATPSENTVRFYQGRGCVLASEVDPELFALEPEDIHLECAL
jgi:predicted N-acetyltransferase YhbS